MAGFLKWAILLLHMNACLYEAGSVGGFAPRNHQSNAGRQFIILPAPRFRNDTLHDVYILTMARSAPRVRVSLVTPRLRPPVRRSFYLDPGLPKWTDLHALIPVRMNASGTHDGAIWMEASHDITVIAAANSSTGSHRSDVMALPVNWAGTLYVLTLKRIVYIMVVAIQQDTKITTYFDVNKSPRLTNFTYTLRGKQLTTRPSEAVVISLSKFESFYALKDTYEIHYLTAMRPVMVQAGFSDLADEHDVTPSPAGKQHQFKDYILPVTQWSDKFWCVGVLKSTVSVTSSSLRARVSVTNCTDSTSYQDYVLEAVGSVIEFSLEDNCIVEIKASAPVHVTQRVHTDDGRAKFQFNVVPVEGFVSTLEKPHSVDRGVIILINSTHLNGLKLYAHEEMSYSKAKKLAAAGDIGVFDFYFALERVTEYYAIERITVHHDSGVRFGVIETQGYNSAKPLDRNEISWTPTGRRYIDVQHSRHCLEGLPSSVTGDTMGMICDNSTEGVVHGNWGQWQEWSCSSECDETEIKHRTRYCNSPATGKYGRPCQGEHMQVDGLCVCHFCNETGHNNGTCLSTRCQRRGRWGEACERKCPKTCYQGVCQKSHGYCIGNCSEGFHGELCHLGCPRGAYGLDCVRVCLNRCLTTNCHAKTGRCEEDGVETAFFMISLPIFIMIPSIVVMVLTKFCRSTPNLVLMRALRIKASVLSYERKVVQHKDSITSNILKTMTEERTTKRSTTI